MKKKLFRITTVPSSLKKLLNEQLKYMNQYYDVFAIASNGPELDYVQKHEGVITFPINMERGIHPIKDFISLIKMILLFNKEKPFIVHTHTPKAGFIGMLAAFVTNTPVRLHTVAGLPLITAVGIKKKILLSIERLTYELSSMVYPNSFGLKKYIVNEFLINSKKIKVIGNGSSNGIDLNYYRPAVKEINFDENYFRFIFIGRVVSNKGVNELIESFNLLSSKYEKVKLNILGRLEEKLDPISNDSIDIIESNNKIKFYGYQDDVRTFLNKSDCLVLPTYREGFPNVLLQALAMKVPVIATDINGCNEIVVSNYNGILIQPQSITQLYKAMELMLLDRKRYFRMIKNSRDSIIKFSKPLILENILKEYKTFD